MVAATQSASAARGPEDLFDASMDVDLDKLSKAAARWDDADLDDASSPQVMLAFYRHLFPFRQLFLWLNASPVPSRLWTHREFAFTLQNEAYLRYNSFATADDLKKEILRLNPARFEIGPIYTAKPKDRRSVQKAAFKAQLRELIFDIDMDEYDENRSCCKGKKICSRCWGFIAMAAKVLDRVFRDDFNFKHILWVYSGRRGIHCWISDPEALAMNDDQRRAIVNYVDILRTGKGDKRINVPRPLHPSISTAYNQVLKTGFGRVILEDQDTFRSDENSEKLLALLPEKDFAGPLREQWKKKGNQSSAAKWDAVQSVGARYKGKEKVTDVLQDVVLQYTYPRIDVEVSKHVNHLLKSPFCVHPGTGRVCVPLSTEEIATFEPEKVPTVGQLLRELEKAGGFKATIEGKSTVGWEQTSLKPFVERFDVHVQELMRDQRDAKKATQAKSTEF